MFLGVGIICSMTIVLLVLPGLLFTLDGIIERTTRGAVFFKPTQEPKGAEKHATHQENMQDDETNQGEANQSETDADDAPAQSDGAAHEPVADAGREPAGACSE